MTTPVRLAVVLLSRIVRSSLPVASATVVGQSTPSHTNGYGGVPAVDLESAASHHLELAVTCRGEVDPQTGYFMDIKTIDAHTRATLVPALSAHLSHGRAQALRHATEALAIPLGRALQAVRWFVTPTASLEVSIMNPASVQLRQKFEIAAAHRLFVPSLSDEQNRSLFGKCASPGGHGHNYVIEPCVAVPLPPVGPPGFTLAHLERLASLTIIEPFDHKNLNTDCPAFDQSRGGVNPSVENISRVFFDLLAPAVARHGATLSSITVWETPKTSSTYPAIER